MSPRRPSRKTKYLVSALQIAITLGILIFLFHDSAKGAQMAEALRRGTWHWLLAGVFAYGAVEILGAVQWQLLLRIQGFRLPWLSARRRPPEFDWCSAGCKIPQDSQPLFSIASGQYNCRNSRYPSLLSR